MVVYVERVLIDNFLLDGLILCAVSLTLRVTASLLRVLCGALVGAVGAVASVYVSGIFAYVYKILLLFAMCITACGFGKKLFWHILLTAAYTFTLGGIVIGLFYLLRVDYLASDGSLYALDVPVALYVVAVCVFAFLVFALHRFLTETKRVQSHVVSATVMFDGKKTTVRAFRDSGNTVSCQGLAVCFVVGKIKGFADYYARCLLAGKCVCVEVFTLCGKQRICAVPALLQVHDETERQVLLALPQNKCPSMYQLIIDV